MLFRSGRDALDLVEGKMAFAVVGGKLKMTHVDDVAEADGPAAELEAEAPDLTE